MDAKPYTDEEIQSIREHMAMLRGHTPYTAMEARWPPPVEPTDDVKVREEIRTWFVAITRARRELVVVEA